MEILDADNGRLLESSTGRIATRDILQFVPMKEIHSGQVSVVQALLEELLSCPRSSIGSPGGTWSSDAGNGLRIEKNLLGLCSPGWVLSTSRPVSELCPFQKD